ncbi:TPA_asm: P6 [Pentaphragma betacytorhabdovirus 1]|nr:TPA_asm: P6 [Pentaphragma betacytorhabdovirus 1]
MERLFDQISGSREQYRELFQTSTLLIGILAAKIYLLTRILRRCRRHLLSARRTLPTHHRSRNI